MRTTLNIRDNVLEDLREFAAARSISTGEATSILVERTLRQTTPCGKMAISMFFLRERDRNR